LHFNVYALTPWISWTLFFGVTLGAFLRAGAEERLACLALLSSLTMTKVFRDTTWSGIQWGALTGDIFMLGVLVVIALRSKRYWPIWAAGFQLLNLITHLSRSIDPKVEAWAYISAQVLFSWLCVIAIGVGVRAAWRERVRVASRLGPS
jgi:hypothetical protein